MPTPVLPTPFHASDSTAIAVEENLRKLESDGYATLTALETSHGIGLRFGVVEARAENYDLALVRLAGALLDDAHFSSIFMARMRGSFNPSHD